MLEEALASQMQPISITIPHSLLLQTHSDRRDGFTGLGQGSGGALLNAVHRLGSLSDITVTEEGTRIIGRVPIFLKKQLEALLLEVGSNGRQHSVEMEDATFDWSALAKGRHKASM